MTQKQQVLNMLKAAGNFGVRSDTYLAEFIPRAAARIKELREDGYEITSEREHQFVRYTLVGVGAEKPQAAHAPLQGFAEIGTASVDSDESISGGRGQAANSRTQPANATPGEPARSRSVPSMFDPDVDWDAAA